MRLTQEAPVSARVGCLALVKMEKGCTEPFGKSHRGTSKKHICQEQCPYGHVAGLWSGIVTDYSTPL